MKLSFFIKVIKAFCLSVLPGFLGLFFLMAHLHASPSQSTLTEALNGYASAQAMVEREGRLAGFAQAERLFRRVIEEEGGTPDLYANLGTSALQAEHLGEAILAFRRALALAPNHERAKQNLHHARTLLPSWVPRPLEQGKFSSFFFWRQSLSQVQIGAVAALAFLLASVGVAVSLRWRMAFARHLALLPALVWGGLMLSLVVGDGEAGVRQGVLVMEETVARAADSLNAPSPFAQPLPGGTEVEILERRQEWVKIGLANGRNAWIRDTALKMVHQG